MESKEIVSIFIGVVNQQGEVTKLSKGTLRVGGSKAVTEDTIFEIGSISKVFTTLLMLELMENRGISLDDEAEKLLPQGMILPT